MFSFFSNTSPSTCPSSLPSYSFIPLLSSHSPSFTLHCCLGFISLLEEAYWYFPTLNLPSLQPSQGSGHLIYRACLLHLSLHFPPPALTDRSPLSLCVHIDHGACERGMLGGREEEGETECPLRTAAAEQTDRWAKTYGSREGSQWRA